MPSQIHLLLGPVGAGKSTFAAKLEAKVGRQMDVIIDAIDDEGATCRTMGDAPEIDGNLFIDEGFEGLSVGEIVKVTVDEASDYDLWGTVSDK